MIDLVAGRGLSGSDAVRAEEPRFRPLVAVAALFVTLGLMVLPAAAGILVLAGVIR